MSSNEIYLVRHGEDIGSELTEQGREQSLLAANQLETLLTDTSSATLLTSDRSRAGQTARIIGRKLGLDLIVSRRLGEAGNSPYLVQEKLSTFFDTCLQEAGVTYDPLNPLIVVTHAPMLAAAAGLSAHKIRNGQVIKYDGSTWDPIDIE